MKKVWLFPIILAGFLLFGCPSTPVSLPTLNPTNNQAVVSVTRESRLGGSSAEWDIFIDDRKAGSVGNGKETRLLVPNGKYFLYVTAVGLGQKSEVVPFTAASNEVAFTTYISGGLHVTQRVANTPSGTNAAGIDGAIRRAGEKFIAELPPQARIAVLSVSAANRDYSSLVADDLETQLSDSHQFVIVERQQLEAARTELNFQMSGEVNDESAKSIGKWLGAGFVITGNITGSGETRRLVLRAINVETAGVILANERF